MAKAMILIRRCTLLFVVCLFTTCASAKNPVLEDSQTFLEKQEIEIKIERIPLDTEVLQNFALESTPSPTVAERLSDIFKLPLAVSEKIVRAADRNAYSDFPSRNDLLAIMAVESSFNPLARLRGSKGLMQINERYHSDKIQNLNLFDIESNVAIGAAILREYFLVLGKNKKAAILANNVGVGNYLRKKFNPKYYLKFLQKLSMISKLQ